MRTPNWRRRVLLGLALVLGLAALPLALVACLFLLNSVNPLQMAFLASFDVVNDSGQDVWVTPIGMWEGAGEYGPLPRYRDRFPPAVWVGPASDLALARNARLKITYDYDDINFRHILVRAASGDVFIVDTDRRGSLHLCYGPQQSTYRIPPLAELSGAPAELLPCVNVDSVSYSGAKQYP